MRQVLYVVGKTFTYVFLGAIVGFVGLVLTENQWVVSSRKALAGAVGVIMIVCGLQMIGVRLRFPVKWLNVQDWGFATQVFDHFVRSPGPWAAFMLGLLTGFLPCPITAVMLVAAATTQSVVGGMIIMGAVGLGTGPVLLAVGCSSGLLSARFRAVGLKAAGVVVLVLGVASLLRGVGILHRHHAQMDHATSGHVAPTGVADPHYEHP